MKTILTTIVIFFSSIVLAQNDVRIYSGSGQPFTLLMNDSILNQTPQVNVILKKMSQDTLQLKIQI